MQFHSLSKTKTKINEAIDDKPLTVVSEMGITELLCLMTQTGRASIERDLIDESRDSSCVLVIEQEKLVGIVTEQDIVRIAASGVELQHLRVGDVMTKGVITAKYSQVDDIFAILKLMRQHQIRHLPVLDNQGKIMGIVTPSSVRRVLQPADLLKLRLVSEVMVIDVVNSPGNILSAKSAVEIT